MPQGGSSTTDNFKTPPPPTTTKQPHQTISTTIGLKNIARLMKPAQGGAIQPPATPPTPAEKPSGTPAPAARTLPLASSPLYVGVGKRLPEQQGPSSQDGRRKRIVLAHEDMHEEGNGGRGSGAYGFQQRMWQSNDAEFADDEDGFGDLSGISAGGDFMDQEDFMYDQTETQADRRWSPAAPRQGTTPAQPHETGVPAKTQHRQQQAMPYDHQDESILENDHQAQNQARQESPAGTPNCEQQRMYGADMTDEQILTEIDELKQNIPTRMAELANLLTRHAQTHATTMEGLKSYTDKLTNRSRAMDAKNTEVRNHFMGFGMLKGAFGAK
ncbi:hypothetical protein HK097_004710 [Rhizophlyctis rosea]|uniref:Uncharacterized protein n=1 Tax=Rhizophlyctis rosea TaxID=64517 RepID=A0AAD5WX89_9FUNG|nr:hypothetical protein HK097_004710 [Rhizophlyctis rosea]